MKKVCIVFVLLLGCACTLYAQKASILDYDPCSEEQESTIKKQFLKAFSYFQDRKYQKASSFLNNIIKEEENFASPYFIMGLIGVNTNNSRMIEKYFPLCVKNCPEFSHPLLWYYLGVVDYSNEKYLQAQKDFQKFIELSDGLEIYDSLQNEAINYLNWSDFLAETMENPVSFNPKRVDYLAEKMNYYEPFFTYDGKELYFLREEIIRDSVRDSFLSTQEIRKEIVTNKATLNDRGFWDRGFREDLPFNSGRQEGRVSITPDNNLLFFSIKNTEADNSTWDIYYCEKYEGYWSDAKAININTNSFDEMQPCISADGNTLYFVSDRIGGKGKYDIWYSKREGKNTWAEPVNMGQFINTALNEMMPTVSLDGKKIYFVSNGWRTIGGFDIFYNSTQAEQKPKNIGYPINTEESEHGIGVMPDGKTAYSVFLDKNKKYYEVNTFVLPPEAQSEARFLYNASTELEVATDITLNILNLTDETISNIFVANSFSNFTLSILPNTNYLLYFNRMGYMFYSKIINSKDKEPVIVSIKPLEQGQRMQLHDIELNPINKDFTHESSVILNSFISFLQFNPHTRITIYAQEDITNKIYNYIIKSGVREDRIDKATSRDGNIYYEIN